ncbi:Glycosyltransferase involved in cell wall bisynthesis [Quadrisphaera granulorum]|uniref:Glycosyltransferase involved in cell wall biosynthesis n=1 Tax=Quadrisphaera granulorum TaxID=317664 RepID=A0A316ABL7_9ACTN|nr:glycosyltransferase [Quadrisphaera granulorum]PWJ55115.1 glycosyltransferase involved in cell wall biosynthesis [Quadrisphaera granulorum]SZE95624.1 Glycosyltransferase involved in cell wall bisynthesis [Quadrisphaera granulorum]
MSQQPRATIVHERFTEYAGSEAVVEALARRWTSAPLLAPVGRRGVLPSDLELRLTTTPLSRLLRGSTYAHLLPALPVAMRTLRLPESDVVIASHHAFATQVAMSTSTPVVAYVHTPARWIWESSMRNAEGGGLGAAGLAAFSAAFKPFDREAAQHVHTMLANSSFVADRIRRWWGREAEVVAPPVNTDYYRPDHRTPREDFFLLAGRLVPYKRPDLAIQAAARAGVKLIVAGEGRAMEHVKALAGPETTFVGRVSDDELRSLFRRCRALLMPGVEDFGIVPVEAQACGAPVIGIGEGGTLDTIRPGVTGELVTPVMDDATAEVDAWAQALVDFEPSAYDSTKIRAHAETFSRASFSARMGAVVDRVLQGPAVPRPRRHPLGIPTAAAPGQLAAAG